jgi:hypothetical protein
MTTKPMRRFSAFGTHGVRVGGWRHGSTPGGSRCPSVLCSDLMQSDSIWFSAGVARYLRRCVAPRRCFGAIALSETLSSASGVVRRCPIGRSSNESGLPADQNVSGLETRDTAYWTSALRPGGALRVFVAQVSNLLFRGFPNRKRLARSSLLEFATPCRLEVGDTTLGRASLHAAGDQSETSSCGIGWASICDVAANGAGARQGVSLYAHLEVPSSMESGSMKEGRFMVPTHRQARMGPSTNSGTGYSRFGACMLAGLGRGAGNLQ